MAILIQLPDQHSGRSARRFSRRRGLPLFAMLLMMAWIPSVMGQGVSREFQIKAVLLFNLTQFVEWPASAFPTNEAPLVIGVLGADPFGAVLDDVVQGEKSNNRPIVVQHFKTSAEATNCQLLFISSSEKQNLPKILPQLKGRSILTVSDFEGFIQGGGMVSFQKKPDDKIQLRINPDAAKASELAVSAKLLRVAEIVRPGAD